MSEKYTDAELIEILVKIDELKNKILDIEKRLGE